jgi:hypothetical protein
MVTDSNTLLDEIIKPGGKARASPEHARFPERSARFDEQAATVARYLKSFPGADDIPVHVVNDIEGIADAPIEHRRLFVGTASSIKSGRSFYSPDFHAIALLQTTGLDEPSVVVHEILHGVTTQVLDAAQVAKGRVISMGGRGQHAVTLLNSLKRTTEGRRALAAADRIEEIFEQTKDVLGRRAAEASQSTPRLRWPWARIPGLTEIESQIQEYGFTNSHEFIAEAFSNPEFRAILKKIELPTTGGKITTVWNELLAAVADVFGVSLKDRNALAEVMKATHELGVSAGAHKKVLFKRVEDAAVRARLGPEVSAAVDAARSQGSLASQLEHVAAAYEKGRLTDKQFEAVKNELLGLTRSAAPVAEGARDLPSPPTTIAPKVTETFKAAQEGDQAAQTAAKQMLGEAAEAKQLWQKIIDEDINPLDPEDGSPYFQKWFGESVVVDDAGKPLVVYHGSDTPNLREFKQEKAGGLFWFTPNQDVAASYSQNRLGVDISTEDAWEDALDSGILDDINENFVTQGYIALRNPLDLRKRLDVIADLDPEFASADMPEWAREYVKRTIKAAKDENYLYFWRETQDARATNAWKNVIVPQLELRGYDGLIMQDAADTGLTYAVFNPTQIKSLKNKGMFDPKNPDIQASLAGALDDSSRYG